MQVFLRNDIDARSRLRKKILACSLLDYYFVLSDGLRTIAV